MNLLILGVDRFHWAYAEPLGNRWIQTPTLNRLAADGVVFGQCYATSPDPVVQWRSLLTGFHPLVMTAEAAESTTALEKRMEPKSLVTALRQRGWRTQFLTESNNFYAMPETAWFEDAGRIGDDGRSGDHGCDCGTCAESMDETELFATMAALHAAIDECADREQPFMIAMHIGSLGWRWDAPLEYRMRYVEGSDPDPGDSARVPSIRFGANGPPDGCRSPDPDALLQVRQAYAGQISLLDELLEPLADWLDDDPVGRQTALLLVGLRGFPLAEHGAIGAAGDLTSDGVTDPSGGIYAETTHVPAILRMPTESMMLDAAVAVRSASLVELSDLAAVLWRVTCGEVPEPVRRTARLPDEPFGGECGEGENGERDRILLVGVNGERGLVTPIWYLRIPRADDDTPAELYLRRDDPFQVNGVANRCHEIVESLTTTLHETESALRTATPSPPLPEIATIEP